MNVKVLDGELCFRDSFRTMLESVNTPFEECKKVLQQSESQLFLSLLQEIEEMACIAKVAEKADRRYRPRPRIQELLHMVQTKQYPRHNRVKRNGTHHPRRPRNALT